MVIAASQRLTLQLFMGSNEERIASLSSGLRIPHNTAAVISAKMGCKPIPTLHAAACMSLARSGTASVVSSAGDGADGARSHQLF
jgi:hypothetical protein